MAIQAAQVSPGRRFWFAGLVAVLPGPPYFAKNYIMAVGGVPLRHMLAVAWPVHLALGVPFVLLGGAAAAANWILSFGSLALFLVMYFVAGRLNSGTATMPIRAVAVTGLTLI